MRRLSPGHPIHQQEGHHAGGRSEDYVQVAEGEEGALGPSVQAEGQDDQGIQAEAGRRMEDERQPVERGTVPVGHAEGDVGVTGLVDEDVVGRCDGGGPGHQGEDADEQDPGRAMDGHSSQPRPQRALLRQLRQRRRHGRHHRRAGGPIEGGATAVIECRTHHPARASSCRSSATVATGADGMAGRTRSIGRATVIWIRRSSTADGEKPARRRATRAVSVSVFRNRTTDLAQDRHDLVGAAKAGDLTLGEQVERDPHHRGQIGERPPVVGRMGQTPRLGPEQGQDLVGHLVPGEQGGPLAGPASPWPRRRPRRSAGAGHRPRPRPGPRPRRSAIPVSPSRIESRRPGRR